LTKKLLDLPSYLDNNRETHIVCDNPFKYTNYFLNILLKYEQNIVDKYYGSLNNAISEIIT